MHQPHCLDRLLVSHEASVGLSRDSAPASCFVLQLPIEDLCSLSSRSLQSPFTATVPDSTEDVLLKGFQMLDMENDRIETAQQVGCVRAADTTNTPKCVVLKQARLSHAVLVFVSVFRLVCQAAVKHGPGWECQIQVCKCLLLLYPSVL